MSQLNVLPLFLLLLGPVAANAQQTIAPEPHSVLK
jgi:hypothetical protein